MRLSDYPFVVVRFRCNLCHRSGQSRLARLADKYGCEITLDALTERMTRDCLTTNPFITALDQPAQMQ